MAESVVLNIQDNEGYEPEQVADRSITLTDMLEAVQEAIKQFGPEARIVLANGQQYGAQYGYISQWADIFETTEIGE